MQMIDKVKNGREKLAQRLIEASQDHGDLDGPQVEVGHLADLFRSAFNLLTPQQVTLFFSSDTVSGMLEIPEFDGLLDDFTDQVRLTA